MCGLTLCAHSLYHMQEVQGTPSLAKRPYTPRARLEYVVAMCGTTRCMSLLMV